MLVNSRNHQDVCLHVFDWPTLLVKTLVDIKCFAAIIRFLREFFFCGFGGWRDFKSLLESDSSKVAWSPS